VTDTADKQVLSLCRQVLEVERDQEIAEAHAVGAGQELERADRELDEARSAWERARGKLQAATNRYADAEADVAVRTHEREQLRAVRQSLLLDLRALLAAIDRAAAEPRAIAS